MKSSAGHPHSVRRTVGTLITHQVSLDAARDQLGHSDPSVTFHHYVGVGAWPLTCGPS